VNASSTPSHPTGYRHRQHSHHYAVDSTAAERRTRIVIAITGAMMVVEIAAGIAFDSMALLADGWHMSTHVSAFPVTTLAYHLSRRHAQDPRYSFGTGKIGVLGGFASAVILGMVGFLMAGESVQRAFLPVPIRFDEAIAVAVIGLLVNVICAFLLKDGHTDHYQDDLNLRSAYLHVLADAFTSVTAVGALLAGRFFGWSWLDPVMGLGRKRGRFRVGLRATARHGRHPARSHTGILGSAGGDPPCAGVRWRCADHRSARVADRRGPLRRDRVPRGA